MTAPAWLVEVVRLKPVPMPWARMIRTPIAICLPLAFGIFTGQIGIGLPIALGGFTSSLVERGGPYLGRGKRVATVGVLGGGLGLTVGLLVRGQGWLVVLVFMVLALLSAALTVGGNAGSASIRGPGEWASAR
ncbi:hypothetical protein [Actinopolymorpha pittospori]|uniref:Membrane protein YccC n=1 Tax=Actinopolymorpha pittospori TaxID=648752 RepID=A0A927MVT4_9ACTN|nr:hypothetical protein [Actinopolymorpha pittospori]MBE1604210.1 putative membrane protein YccC [Actinopolymorpha pittospori]